MALRILSVGLVLSALLCVGGCRSHSNYCPTPCARPAPCCPTPVVAPPRPRAATLRSPRPRDRAAHATLPALGRPAPRPGRLLPLPRIPLMCTLPHWLAVLGACLQPNDYARERRRADSLPLRSRRPVGPHDAGRGRSERRTVVERVRTLSTTAEPYPYVVRPNQMVTFHHPVTGANVTIPLRLPEDTPPSSTDRIASSTTTAPIPSAPCFCPMAPSRRFTAIRLACGSIDARPRLALAFPACVS